jgi:hypothetical protein
MLHRYDFSLQCETHYREAAAGYGGVWLCSSLVDMVPPELPPLFVLYIEQQDIKRHLNIVEHNHYPNHQFK